MYEEGGRRALPAGLDLTAFRIVQESLTNVIRHSIARQAAVVLDWRDPESLVVRIDDPGPAAPGDAGGTGSGLAGMRERAAAFGGTITAERSPDGGFRVRAVLPTSERPGEHPAGGRPTGGRPAGGRSGAAGTEESE